MKRNEQISGNPSGDARQTAPKAIKGSTIIAVLASMVFIGVVTASMLKNTGSQSAASVSYGTMQTMASTVRSGAIATETYFEKTDSIGTLTLITNSLNAKPSDSDAKKKPFIFGEKTNKTQINNGQYFNSRLDTVYRKNDTTARSRFEINSGRANNGKNAKKAMAYYDMNVRIRTAFEYNASNAVYMRGSLADGNNGMEVDNGGITIEGNVRFQNTESIFHGDAYFNGNVDIMKKAKFEKKAYFNGYLNIQSENTSTNAGLMFDAAVGIKGNLSTGSGVSASDKKVGVGGDVWLGGDFINPNGVGRDGITLSGSGNPKNTFHYTENIPMKTQGACSMCPSSGTCTPTPSNTNTCCPHGCNHPDSLGKISARVDTGAFVNAYRPNMDVKNDLGMGTIEQRRDPQLSIYNFDPATKKYTNEYKPEISSSMYSVTDVRSAQGCDGKFSVACIDSLYKKAAAAGKLYNDHLVVKVGPNDWLNNDMNPPASTPKLEKKIMLILDDGAQLSGGVKYFDTDPKSSTLLYVGKNAQINELGIDGTFHGLIYIDSANVVPGAANGAKNSVNFGANSKIVGAIHSFTESNFVWNTGAGAKPPVIQFSREILNNYSTLVKGSSENTFTAEFVDAVDNRRIHLKPFGYYFY